MDESAFHTYEFLSWQVWSKNGLEIKLRREVDSLIAELRW